MSAPAPTQLDFEQAVRGAYDDSTGSLRTEGSISNTITNPVPVTIVDGSITGLTVISSNVVPFGSINGSGGSTFTIIASTSAQIAKIVPNEQTGVALNIYTGANLSETLLVTLAPGQDNVFEAAIAAGTRVSVRAFGSSAPTAGSLYITFLG